MYFVHEHAHVQIQVFMTHIVSKTSRARKGGKKDF